MRIRVVAAVVAGLASAGLAVAPPALASPSAHPPKRHYVGSCQAVGREPVCMIDPHAASDVRHFYVHVWGHLAVPGQGKGRIVGDYEDECRRGNGSGSASGTVTGFPAYTRTLKQAYVRPSACSVESEFGGASARASGTIHARMYYTRRDGK